MPGEPCRCYKCIEAKLAKCEKEKEKECNHIDMVNNVLTKRIEDLGQCLADHNHQNNEEYRKIKDRLDDLEKREVNNVESFGKILLRLQYLEDQDRNFNAIKEQIEEVEKSIADQAIKALHTHPEFLQPLSDMTKRISELDERLQDQVDDHCGRIKDLEGWIGTPANEDWTTFKLQLMKQAQRLEKLEQRMTWQESEWSGLKTFAKSIEERLNNLAKNLTDDYSKVIKRLNDWNDRQKI